MKLVIAEKPMLARDIARAICGKEVSETARLPISGNGYIVTACAGHLLKFSAPDDVREDWGQPWTTEVLPIYLDQWPKVPDSGKENLINEIKYLLDQADSVIHAGDPDDEGQLIVDELLEYLNYKGLVERVFVNDNIEKNIVKAFQSLVPNETCIGAGKAAQARSLADFVFGINESRLATLKCHRKVSVGRVQTPTLGLIVNRDRAIENHVKNKYYETEADIFIEEIGNVIFKFKPSSQLLGEDKVLLSDEIPKVLRTDLPGRQLGITTIEKEEKVAPPLPFNLTKLISYMSKKYKYTAAQVQNTTQALRDKYKAITYNRTDCQYLKEEHFTEAPQVLHHALLNLGRSLDLDFSIKSKAFNDKNVTAHHGIIPQEMKLDISQMSQMELNVYREIVLRYAMQFMKPETSIVSISTIVIDQGILEYKVSRITDPGWRNGNPEKGIWIPEGAYKGAVISVAIITKETAPPKPYTEGTLISDMASIAKYVEDKEIKAILKKKDDGKKGENGGIGTTATRSTIIEILKKRGFIEEEKGVIHATSLGKEFFDLLPDEIKKADTTAKWWLLQQQVANGEADVTAIQENVIDVFCIHQDSAYAEADLRQKATVIGKCPLCGGAIVDIDNSKLQAYKCEEKSCDFILWKKQFGSKLNAADMGRLLLEGRTGIMNFKSKSGKAYRARLKFKTDKKSLELDFINNKSRGKSNGELGSPLKKQWL